MAGVSSVRMPMTEEGKVDGWYVYYILFSFGIVSHNCIPNLSSHSIHFLFYSQHYYRRQSTDGVLATVREGTLKVVNMMSRGWLEWKALQMR